MLVVELEQRLLEFGQLEEPVLLPARTLDGALAVGAHEDAVLVLFQIAFGVVGFLVHAVPALVGTLVAVALVVEVLPELPHGARVARLGRAHEVGVGDVKQVPYVAERRLHRVAPFLRGHPLAGRRVGHLLAVLVHAGDERHVVAVHALVAGNRVGRDRRVGGAQMRGGIHVIDRGGERIGSL